MLVTSGLVYAIVPSGATLALRVLSSYSNLTECKTCQKFPKVVTAGKLIGTSPKRTSSPRFVDRLSQRPPSGSTVEPDRSPTS